MLLSANGFDRRLGFEVNIRKLGYPVVLCKYFTSVKFWVGLVEFVEQRNSAGEI